MSDQKNPNAEALPSVDAPDSGRLTTVPIMTGPARMPTPPAMPVSRDPRPTPRMMPAAPVSSTAVPQPAPSSPYGPPPPRAGSLPTPSSPSMPFPLPGPIAQAVAHALGQGASHGATPQQAAAHPRQATTLQTMPMQPVAAATRAPQPPGSGPDLHANSTGNFRVPSPPPSQRGVVSPAGTVQFPQPGTTLVSPRGSYAVLRLLGGGEFGAVYECVGPFDQIYAVKMIRPANRPYDDVHKEWALEAKRLLSLRHPNVVYIHDAFEQGNLFYLSLERCDHPLTAMLGAPMREGLVIELARQLLAAVQFLHDSDIVHDDLHPGNVLITHTDRPTVKISDFGISHELGGAPAIRPNVVHHKIMAPEVLASGYTSKQSDLYQVGLLLYWMLAGEPAIPPGLPYQELAHFVASGAPRQKAEQFGTPLGDLVAKLLRRRESYRYTTPREAWNELRELPTWQNRELFPAK